MERSEILGIISKEYSNWQIDPKPLGNGSFGVVFQMVNADTGEKRALKVIPIPHDDNEVESRLVRGYPEKEVEKSYEGVKNRVLDEIINIIQLRSNDNVINIFGYREIRRSNRIGWLVCFDMEYLSPLIETDSLTEEQIIRMGLDMCNALKACHARKIVHRDIKPENILHKGDSYVLADFGVSKVASSQSSLSLRGTYDYMAPELVRHETFSDVSPDTVDIYSLGITLYLYANQNRLPFVESVKEMMYADSRDEANMKRWNNAALPNPSGVSARLGKIILCACEHDPRRRYQSAAEMEYDLMHVAGAEYLYADRMKELAIAKANPASPIVPAPMAAGNVSSVQPQVPRQPVYQPPMQAQQFPQQFPQQPPYQQQMPNPQPIPNLQQNPSLVRQIPAVPVNNTSASTNTVTSSVPSSKTQGPTMPFSMKPSSETPKKKKKGLIIGIVATVLAVAIAVVGCVFFFGDVSSDEEKVTVSRSEKETITTAKQTKTTTKATTKATTKPATVATTTAEPSPTTAEFTLQNGQTTALLTYGSGPVEIFLSTMSSEVPLFVKVFMDQNPDMASKYRVTCFICSNTGRAYETWLNSSLVAGGSAAPDIYVAEADYILPYTQGEFSRYAAPYDTFIDDFSGKIKAAQIAQYTIDLGTNTDGRVLGLAYQNTGGAMIYSASIAKEVFGSDDPSTVKAAVGGGSGSWDTFRQAAAKLKDAGYAVCADFVDLWNVCEKAGSTPWVVNGKVYIDPQREAYMDLIKDAYDNNWTNETGTWNDAWYAAMNGESRDPKTNEKRRVFAFFGPAWLINYTMSGHSNNTIGDWRVCESPVGFWWGGSWLCVNKAASLNPDKREFVSRFVEWVTLDTSDSGLQYLWATGAMNDNGTKDTVASATVLAKVKGDMALLGGQDAFPIFISATSFASAKCKSIYDSQLNSQFINNAADYANGQKSKDEAINSFKQYCKSMGLDV